MTTTSPAVKTGLARACGKSNLTSQELHTKAEHEAELKTVLCCQTQADCRIPRWKSEYEKLSEEYDALVQTHTTTYEQFKVREDLQRLWKVKSCVDTAARSMVCVTKEQMLQKSTYQTRHKKEGISL